MNPHTPPDIAHKAGKYVAIPAGGIQFAISLP